MEFLTNAFFYTKLTYLLYPIESKQCKVIKEAIPYWQMYTDISCQTCRVNSHNQIKMAQLQIEVQEKNDKNIIELCLKELQRSSRRKNKQIQDMYEGYYLGRLVQSLGRCGRKTINYLPFVFGLVRKRQYYSYVFCFYYGNQLFNFITYYTLIQINNIQLYVQFLVFILNHIKKHPNKEHIRIVMLYQKNIYIQMHEQFQSKISVITNALLENGKDEQYKNNYLCLLYGFYLSFPISANHSYQLLVRSCKNVDMVSINARIYVLEDLFDIYGRTKYFLLI